MNELRRRRWRIFPVTIVLLCAVACSRPTGVPATGSADESAAPFHPEAGGDRDIAGPQPAVLPENSLPFHDSETLPPGTLVTVRLKGPITAATSITANSFTAVVDEPVMVEGNILLPRGTTVSGRIKSARISTVKPNRAYVRLVLESLHVGGLDVPIQTASLYTRQNPETDDLIRLEDGRRLTFRLTESVYLGTQRAQMGR
jgi:hypothetical protein